MDDIKNTDVENTEEDYTTCYTPLEESSMDLENGKDDCNSFKNYPAFASNFGELIILQDKYDKNWKVYVPTRTEPNDYIYYADSRDNIEGWLYGAVMANNGLIKKFKGESLEEDKKKETT